MERTRPALKWAGGKYRLLDGILAELPAGARLVEPFVGSGAVFLNSDYPAYLLCDVNADLILFHRTLAERKAGFVAECRELFADGNSSDVFYRRRERFNSGADGEERAALFLYLNRHGYNGLVRYNSRGVFNVPFGRHARPRFPDREMAAFVAKLERCDVEFRHCDFREAFSLLRRGDVVYCDPPYLPLSDTAKFTAYSGHVFALADQEALAALAADAAAAGVRLVMSNHSGEAARRLYRGATRIREFSVRRSISCVGSGRGEVGEVLAVY